MFNLDQAIAEWRRQMAAGGIKSPEVLNELESHLRDEIDEQMQSGLDAQESFMTAVQRMGKAPLLKRELENSTAKRIPSWQVANLKIAALLCVPLLVVVGVIDFGTGMALGGKLIGGVVIVLLFIFALRYAVRECGPTRGAHPTCPWTPDASHALDIARQQALCFHHDFVGTEHVLLGLLQSEKGVVCQVLEKMGIGREAIRIEIANLVGIGPDSNSASNLPCTPRAMRALELAASEAKAMQHSHVRPEHLFLGLLLEGTGVAALTLRNLGVDFGRTRDEILKARANQNHG